MARKNDSKFEKKVDNISLQCCMATRATQGLHGSMIYLSSFYCLWLTNVARHNEVTNELIDFYTEAM